MRRRLATLGLVLGVAGWALSTGSAVYGVEQPTAERPVKVALIVGPVGEQLTPVYIGFAEEAAKAALAQGATVARAYSPAATPEKVLAAVRDADIVVYLGHGVGFPNPYSALPLPDRTNGWGLQGPNAQGTNEDSWRDGTLAYFGEEWIVAHARPAPGFVMIYSNACYAPGAGEGGHAQASPEEAAARVANYARPAFALGASAYFATDFSAGAAQLVGSMLRDPSRSYGQIFASDPRFVPTALERHPLAGAAGREVWLHRSPYLNGITDYWYAFAGDPKLAPGTGRTSSASQRVSVQAGPPPNEVVGIASHYSFTRGFEESPTVGLPDALGGRATLSVNGWVVVCADRCARIPVVDSCPCYWGTPDQRVVNLSETAWSLVSSAPLEKGLIRVTLYLNGSYPAEALRQRDPSVLLDRSAAGAIQPSARVAVALGDQRLEHIHAESAR
ncbi:MAG: hypothetical protein M3R49_09615 [Chloroflexota bacterium]|nr:hypothetical protein [Chloroflexota bacterium]